MFSNVLSVATSLVKPVKSEDDFQFVNDSFEDAERLMVRSSSHSMVSSFLLFFFPFVAWSRNFFFFVFFLSFFFFFFLTRR